MKTERLIAIIMILMEQKKITAAKLAEMFNVTKRTIYRDIDAINLAGIPIVTTNGSNGGISIMENYKVDKNLFTTNDLINLIFGLNSISILLPNSNLKNTIGKIKSLIPKDYLETLEAQLSYMKIDYTPWTVDRLFFRNLEKIKESIKKNNIILFNYFNEIKQKHTYEVEPYRLFFRNGDWYLQGFCLDSNNFNIFDLSNIFSLEILNKKFILRENDFSYSNFHLENKDIVEFIIIKIDESLYDFICELCGKESIISKEKDKYIVNFPFSYIDRLFNFGIKCEIIQPENIRLEYIEKLKSILKIYEI